jgi:hypothetical protein
VRRLTILLAAVGALMLVPAASAFAEEPHAKVNIEGSGNGEVTSVSGTFGIEPGTPPIACSYASPGPATGVCENEPAEPNSPGFYQIQLYAQAAPGSEFGGWSAPKGGSVYEGYGNDCPLYEKTGPHPKEECELENYEPGEGIEFEVTATFCKEGTAIEEMVYNEAHFEEELMLVGCSEPITPNLKLNVEEGSGTVVSNPAGLECTASAPESCEAEVAEGLTTLTASPAPGYLVKSWKGCDSGGVNGRQCKVTVGSSLKTVGVKFYKVFSLAGSKTGGLGIMGTTPGGINCSYACNSSTALYKEGSLTVKAKPAKHFHFVEFTGGTNSAASCNGVTTETCAISTFNSNSSIVEVYAEDAKNTLTLTKSGGGQGFVKTKPTNVNCGLTCTAAEAEFFASESPEVSVTLGKGTTQVTWTSGAGTCTGHATSCSVPMSSSHSLVAEFS